MIFVRVSMNVTRRAVPSHVNCNSTRPLPRGLACGVRNAGGPGPEWLASNRSAFVIADRFPVSPGHAHVVPRRQIATWWEASEHERADLLALVDEVKR
jgi:diadenosine tetraphosphate (Ap4A) HIT family hydrolase